MSESLIDVRSYSVAHLPIWNMNECLISICIKKISINNIIIMVTLFKPLETTSFDKSIG